MRNWIFGALALMVWSTGCTYWYVCQIKGLCPEGWNLFAGAPSSTPSQDSLPATAIATPEPEDSVGETPEDSLRPDGEANAGATIPGTLAEPKTILFAFAGPQSEGLPATEAYLDELASYLKANPSSKVRVRGYTDDTAARENNLKLAQRRCDVIVEMLQQRSVDPGQVVTEPMGEADPVATNDTPEGRRLNRRVVISIQQ